MGSGEWGKYYQLLLTTPYSLLPFSVKLATSKILGYACGKENSTHR